MSTRTVRTPVHARDVISERAARRAGAHPRTVALPDTAAAPALATTAAVTAGRDALSPGGQAHVLRRWSVAVLIASASGPRVAA